MINLTKFNLGAKINIFLYKSTERSRLHSLSAHKQYRSERASSSFVLISRVYTSRFGNGTVRWNLDRSGTKKVSGTRYSTQWKTPQKWTVLCRTVPYHAVEKRHKSGLFELASSFLRLHDCFLLLQLNARHICVDMIKIMRNTYNPARVFRLCTWQEADACRTHWRGESEMQLESCRAGYKR